MEDLGSFLREHKKWDRRFKLFFFLNLSSTLSDSAYGSHIYENLNIFLAVSKKKKNLFLAQYIIIFFTLNSSLKLYTYIYILAEYSSCDQEHRSQADQLLIF